VTDMPSIRVRDEIEFRSNALLLRGWISLPDGRGPHALVILGHGLGGLKEWTIPDVADAFLEAGIGAMAFDFRNYGDSEGEPREEVDHCGRIEDWQSAISYATTLPEIDPDRIGLWGTSLGGRDVLAVAAIDRRVKCVVSQVPAIKWDAALGSLMAGFGDDHEQYHRALADDRRDRALGKEPRYVSFENPDVEDDGGAGEYQSTWGEAERRNYQPRITLQSFQPTVLSDMTPLMAQISPTPLRMLIADGDFLPAQREAFEAALEPKSLLEFEGHHYSLYTSYKQEAITAAREWFSEYLTR